MTAAGLGDDGIREMFATLGAVSIRRVFSGKGVYVQGMIIAIEYDGELRLKADHISAPAFQAAGSAQWTYHGRRGPVLMPYWSIPDDAVDSTDRMEQWVRRALEAALRNPKTKRRDHRR